MGLGAPRPLPICREQLLPAVLGSCCQILTLLLPLLYAGILSTCTAGSSHGWGGSSCCPFPPPPHLVSLCTSWCRSVGSPQPAAHGVGWVAVSLCPPAGLGLSLVCGGETGMQLLACASHSQPSGLGFCRGGDGARCSGGSQCLGGGCTPSSLPHHHDLHREKN